MALQLNKSTSVTIDEIDYTYFGGTNYLGLAHRPELMRAAEQAFAKFGFSAGAARLTSGENSALLQLERELARFGRSEASLVLPAGYMSNYAVVDAMDDLVDAWIVSSGAHGSIKSALQASKKRVIIDDGDSDIPYSKKHNLSAQGKIAVFCEPIDPLMGTLFDVRKIIPKVSDQDFIVIDEAHSFGVLGASGAGAVEHFDLKTASVIRTGTFSKAIGTSGGFVLGSKEVIQRIMQLSHCYKSSTPLSPLAVAATLESLQLIQDDADTTIKKLKGNIKFVNEELERCGFPAHKDNQVPIFHLDTTPAINKMRDTARAAGLYLPTVSSYFAGACEIGLRWTVQAGHSTSDLNKLLSFIRTNK